MFCPRCSKTLSDEAYCSFCKANLTDMDYSKEHYCPLCAKKTVAGHLVCDDCGVEQSGKTEDKPQHSVGSKNVLGVKLKKESVGFILDEDEVDDFIKSNPPKTIPKNLENEFQTLNPVDPELMSNFIVDLVKILFFDYKTFKRLYKQQPWDLLSGFLILFGVLSMMVPALTAAIQANNETPFNAFVDMMAIGLVSIASQFLLVIFFTFILHPVLQYFGAIKDFWATLLTIFIVSDSLFLLKIFLSFILSILSFFGFFSKICLFKPFILSAPLLLSIYVLFLFAYYLRIIHLMPFYRIVISFFISAILFMILSILFSVFFPLKNMMIG